MEIVHLPSAELSVLLSFPCLDFPSCVVFQFEGNQGAKSISLKLVIYDFLSLIDPIFRDATFDVKVTLF